MSQYSPRRLLWLVFGFCLPVAAQAPYEPITVDPFSEGTRSFQKR
ncbi:MAG: hypothetical protein ACI80V_000375 [Rhodothermales bacterium]|jgi:hypothetical protein